MPSSCGRATSRSSTGTTSIPTTRGSACRTSCACSRRPRFITDLKNTAVFTVIFWSQCLFLGLLLAILLDQRIRGEAFFRTVYVLPFAISAIVTGVAWKWLFYPAVRHQRHLRCRRARLPAEPLVCGPAHRDLGDGHRRRLADVWLHHGVVSGRPAQHPRRVARRCQDRRRQRLPVLPPRRDSTGDARHADRADHPGHHLAAPVRSARVHDRQRTGLRHRHARLLHVPDDVPAVPLLDRRGHRRGHAGRGAAVDRARISSPFATRSSGDEHLSSGSAARCCTSSCCSSPRIT